MKEQRKHSSTSNIHRVKLLDSSSTTGAGLTGLTSASSGLIISTIADNEATATVYTQAAGNIEGITTLGTYAAPTASKCRFKEVDATNHPGVYEIQLLDARYSVSSAKRLVISITGATNLVETDLEIELVAYDPQDAVRMGQTALPNAAAGANGGLPTVNANNAVLVQSGTGTGQLDFTTGVVKSNPVQLNGGSQSLLDLKDFADEGYDPAANKVAGVVLVDTTTTNTDMRGTDAAALASVWTATRGGYVDNLNIGENVAGTSEVTAIQNTTRSKAVHPATVERPDSGSVTPKLRLYLYDTNGAMEAPDSLPTITAENDAGTDRSGNLGTVTNTDTGEYEVTYTVASGHAVENLRGVWTYVEGGNTIKVPWALVVVDTTAVDFTSSDRTKLDALHDTRCTEARMSELDGANMPADIDAIVAAVAATALRAAIGLAAADLDTQLAALASQASVDIIDGEVGQVLEDTGTTIPATLAGKASQASVDTVDGEVGQILAKVVTAAALPGAGAPPNTADLQTMIQHLYKAYRNKTEQTASEGRVYDDAGAAVEQKWSVSDDGTTLTVGEVASGP